MAHGYYLGAGKPLAVMVHVTVGTANASTAIITASRANVPLLMSAGRTPITEEGMEGARDLHIHWAQESFDQAAMLREYVKWDYELRNPVQLESAVDRALELMLAEPRVPCTSRCRARCSRHDCRRSPSRRRPGARRPASAIRIPRASTRRRACSPARSPLILVPGSGRDERAVPPSSPSPRRAGSAWSRRIPST